MWWIFGSMCSSANAGKPFCLPLRVARVTMKIDIPVINSLSIFLIYNRRKIL